MIGLRPEADILKLCDKIYDMTDFISADYPKHKSWFYQKHLPGVLTPNSGREIILASENGKMLGTAFTKNDKEEKKICTIFVDEIARGTGVTTGICEEVFKVLGTTRPLITIADYKIGMFNGIIKKYGWEQTRSVKGLYNDRHEELFFNEK
jgi:hypothetical protein